MEGVKLVFQRDPFDVPVAFCKRTKIDEQTGISE
jgi:hypothetical protein